MKIYPVTPQQKQLQNVYFPLKTENNHYASSILKIYV